MKAFRFRLQSILDLRHREMNDALRAFGEATRAREVMEAQLNRQTQARDSALATWTETRTKTFHVAQEQHGQIALAAVEEERRALGQQVGTARKKELQKRQAYLQAKVRLDAFTKLKAKAEDDFQRELRRKEEQELEDVVNARWRRAV